MASTPAQAVAGVDAAITMLTNADALQQVVLGDNGIAAALSGDQLLIDMSTVGTDAVRSIAARLPHGVTMVDAGPDAPGAGDSPERPGGPADPAWPPSTVGERT